MALADKIIDLRKKMGWSQEQLAEFMNISRQSVSKWESGASVPELDKVIKMSDLFGVTTDYLLKEDWNDNLGGSVYKRREDGIDDTGMGYTKDTAGEGGIFEAETKGGYSEERETAGREVPWEEAVSFMDLAREVSAKIALGVSLCVLSPICLLLLGAIAEWKAWLSEDMAGGIGLIVLLGFVAAGVWLLISCGMKTDKYEYLEKENIRISPDLRKLVSEKKEEFAPVYRKSVLAGVMLCIFSTCPLFIAAGFNAEDFIAVCCVCILLVIVAAGVYCFVRYGTIQGSFDKLLEEGDYTRGKKTENKGISVFSSIYWCCVAALYFGISLVTNQWQITWVVFVVAGILFPAVLGIIRLIRQ